MSEYLPLCSDDENEKDYYDYSLKIIFKNNTKYLYWMNSIKKMKDVRYNNGELRADCKPKY